MKRFVSTGFFSALQDASLTGNEVNIDILKNGYDEFALFIFSEKKSSTDKEDYHNALVYTYIELSCLIAGTRKNTAVYLEKAICLVDKQMEFVENQIWAELTGSDCPFKHKSLFGIKLKWTANIVDYVEWVYGLHEILNLHGGRVTLIRLFQVFNSVFGVNVTAFSQYFKTIKTRKKGDRTTFLNKQKQLLEQRMEESDNITSRK